MSLLGWVSPWFIWGTWRLWGYDKPFSLPMLCLHLSVAYFRADSYTFTICSLQKKKGRQNSNRFLLRIIHTQVRVAMVRFLIKIIVTLIYKTAGNILARKVKMSLQISCMSNRLPPEHLWFGVKMREMTGSKNFSCVEATSEQIIIHPKSPPFSEALSQSVKKQSGLQRLECTMLY